MLLDVDGTLLDSNDAHTRAWVRALEQHGHPVPYDRVRPYIGKGGDKLLADLVGISDESPEGKAINETRRQLFSDEMLPALLPTRGARQLLERCTAAGLRLVVASSAAAAELDGLLRQAGVADLISATATSSDATHSKPDPDIVQAALDKAEVAAASAVMLGDTPHDVEAAARAGVGTIALRCGGWWSGADLADAIAVYDDPLGLLAAWDTSPFADAASIAPGASFVADPSVTRSSSTHANIGGEVSPRLPSEHDESSSSTSAVPDPRMQQAARDLQDGMRSTDRSEATDELYARTLRDSDERSRAAEQSDPAGDVDRR